jgi:uncharacterized repeat protein (TIGR03803 family)
MARLLSLSSTHLSDIAYNALLLLWIGLAVASASSGKSEKVLHAFAPRDGANPQALVTDGEGNLYGVDYIGGNVAGSSCSYSIGTGCGSVFELSPTSSGGWKFSVLYKFTGGADGRGPVDLAIDADGNIFGVAQEGGNTTGCVGGHGCGTLFELERSASGRHFTVLHSFTGPADGSIPAALTRDAAGSLYVTLQNGGNTDCGVGCGTIFRMQPTSSKGWRGSTLRIFDWTFNNQGAASPYGRVNFDADGNLYGVAGGGTYNTVWSANFGVVYKLRPSSAGQWKETVLYSFCPGTTVNCNDGANPVAGPILDSSGNIYGTTVYGGLYNSGTVFELTPSTSGLWGDSVLYSFTGGTDGANPVSPVTFDAGGDLFGTTQNGGNATCIFGPCGVLFELASTSSGWQQTVLHSFAGSYDGANPSSTSGLLLDQSGNLFGTAVYGGLSSSTCNSLCGVLYEYGPVNASNH